MTCPHCNKSFQAREAYAGRRGRCPQCKGVIQVPGASAPSGPAAAGHAPPAAVLARRIDDAEEKRRQCARSSPALKALRDAAHSLRELRNEHASLSALVENLEGNEENKHLVTTILKTMEAIQRHLESMRRRLNATRYPLDHAQGEISIGDYMLDRLPAPDDLGATYQAGQRALEALSSLYVRLMARLARVAEEVERVLGLEPLPEPPPKKEVPNREA